MRAKLNEQKESYFKKMKKAGMTPTNARLRPHSLDSFQASSFAGKLELATARAAAQVAEVTEENGKYKAMVQVLCHMPRLHVCRRRGLPWCCTLVGFEEKGCDG